MAMDWTGPAWGAAGGAVAVVLTKLFDGFVKVTKARSESREKSAKIDMERDANEDHQEEKKENRTIDQMWRLVEDVKAARDQDRKDYDRRETALNTRVDALSKLLDNCKDDHRKVSVDLGAALARIELLEQRGGRRRSPDSSATHKPLGDDQP